MQGVFRQLHNIESVMCKVEQVLLSWVPQMMVSFCTEMAWVVGGPIMLRPPLSSLLIDTLCVLSVAEGLGKTHMSHIIPTQW